MGRLYRQISGICTREQQRNRRVREALVLFDRIRDELGIDPFSYAEFRESVNDLVSSNKADGAMKCMRYGRSHLATLVKLELIEHDDFTGQYSINVCATPPGERQEELDDEG